jgi:NADH-quinone oxidoreductase subunit J
MLLDLKAEQKRRFQLGMFVLGLLVALLFCYQIALVLDSVKGGSTAASSLPAGGNDVPAIGTLLFTQYLLPFEITSVLLLVATVGVILISRKEGS